MSEKFIPSAIHPERGPLEIVCAAPPYPIVQACNAIGLERPEDMRWHYDPYEGHRHGVPKLQKYRFTYSRGDKVTYSIGQCPKCGTIFWTGG